MQVSFINNQLKSRGIITESLSLENVDNSDDILTCIRTRLEEIDSVHDKIEQVRRDIQRAEADNAIKRREIKHMEFQQRQNENLYTRFGFDLEVLEYRKDALLNERKQVKLECQETAIELNALKARCSFELEQAENMEAPIMQVSSRGGFFSVPGPLSLVHQSIRPATATPLESDISESYETREIELNNEICRLYDFIWKQVPEISTIVAQVKNPSIDDLKTVVRSMLDMLEKNHMRPRASNKDSFENVQTQIDKLNEEHDAQQLELNMLQTRSS